MANTAQSIAWGVAEVCCTCVVTMVGIVGAEEWYYRVGSIIIDKRKLRSDNDTQRVRFNAEVKRDMLLHGHSRHTAQVRVYKQWKQTGEWDAHFESRA